MLQPIQWTEDMRVGSPSLDGQHQHIISVLNELLAAHATETTSDTVAENLALYSRLVYEHFRYEEEVQAAIGYPDLERHRGEHLAYNTRVTWICQRSMGGDEVVPHELLEFLREWWEEHILVEDAKYREFLGKDS